MMFLAFSQSVSVFFRVAHFELAVMDAELLGCDHVYRESESPHSVKRKGRLIFG